MRVWRLFQAWGKLLFCPLLFRTTSKSERLPCPWRLRSGFVLLASRSLRPAANGTDHAPSAAIVTDRFADSSSSSRCCASWPELFASIMCELRIRCYTLSGQDLASWQTWLNMLEKYYLLSVGTEKPTLAKPDFIVPLVFTSYDSTRMQDSVRNRSVPIWVHLR